VDEANADDADGEDVQGWHTEKFGDRKRRSSERPMSGS